MPDLGPPLSPTPFWRSPFDGIILPVIPRTPSSLVASIVLGTLFCQALVNEKLNGIYALWVSYLIFPLQALSVGHCLGPRWYVPLILLPEVGNWGICESGNQLHDFRKPPKVLHSTKSNIHMKNALVSPFAPGEF